MRACRRRTLPRRLASASGRRARRGAAAPPAPAAAAPVAPVAPPRVAGAAGDPELERVRADVDFWAARLTAHPNDIVAAVKLAEADAAEARLTGDVTAYVRAEQAAGAAIVAQPGYSRPTRCAPRSSSRSTGSPRP